MTINPAAEYSSLVGIGRLVRLDGQRRNGEPFALEATAREGIWLAWRGDPKTGNIILVRPYGRAKAGNQTTRQMHREFHDAEPVDWKRVEWIPPKHAIEHVGFARSITYTIPSGMQSNKNEEAEGRKTEWQHFFGDFGYGVDDRDNPSYWPGVAVGHDGSVYLMRRRENRYRLQDWLVG